MKLRLIVGLVHVMGLLLQCGVRWTSADIVGTDPEDGSCLCPTSDNQSIRDAPCGNIIGTFGINECYRYTGNNTICTLDIDYHFYQLDFTGGQYGWTVGNYLNLEPSSYCSEFPCGAPAPGLLQDGSSGRIIGGTDAVRNMYPWQLVLEEDDSGTWVLTCGAALIDANWAVTAAHCVESLSKPLRIVAGVYNRSEPIGQDQIQNINENHITIHPNYTSTTLENDIAILHITSAYDLSGETIRTICLPPSSSMEYVENPQCYLTGWGITTENANLTETPMVLQRTGIDVIHERNCLYDLERLILDSETCTLDQVDRLVTPCTGDMGGPLSCLVNTRFQLAGIGSFTYDNCNPRMPQIYAKVPYFVDWIRAVTGLE